MGQIFVALLAGDYSKEAGAFLIVKVNNNLSGNTGKSAALGMSVSRNRLSPRTSVSEGILYFYPHLSPTS